MNRTLFSLLFGAVALVLAGCGASVDGGDGVFRQEADLAVTSGLDKATVEPGTNVIQTATIRNVGPRNTSNVPVNFAVDGADFVGRTDLNVTCSVTGEGECSGLTLNAEEGTLEGTVSLDFEAEATYVLRRSLPYNTDVQAGDAAIFEACAGEDADSPDPDLTNNCGTAEAVIGERPALVDFRDEIIYWALTDRFNNGDPSNDAGNSGRTPDPGQPFDWHGGDFAGLQQKVEEGYFQSMGFTAIWISPVVLQIPDFEYTSGEPDNAYHGYWLENYDDPEPHFGEWSELKALVDAAHAADLKVIIDFVANHAGYDAQIVQNEPDWFRQDVPECDLAEEVVCTLFFLPDIRQEVDGARNWVLEGARNVLLQSGADGFRIDTYKHVNPDFWFDFFAPGAPGDRSTVFSVGETFTNSALEIASDLDEDGAPAMFDFPLYGAITEALARGGDSSDVADVFENDPTYADPTRLATFLDNHDVVRYMTQALRAGYTLQQAQERLSMGLGLLYGTRGIPTVYYGTETGMRGGEDPDNRRDMVFPTAALAKAGASKLGKPTCGVTGTGDPDEAYGVPFFLRGSFNGWADPPPPETLFQNMGGDIYEVELQFDSGLWEFKVANADWSVVNLSANGEVALGEPVTLRTSSFVNSSIILVDDGCYNFRLDVSNPDSPILTVTRAILDDTKTVCGVTGTGDPAEAYGVPFFARGGFNDWGEPPESRFENFGGNDYQAEFLVSAGTWQFKVASSDWSTVDFTADAEVFLDTGVTLQPGAGRGNTLITLEKDGCYNFGLDLSDTAAPVLTITRVDYVTGPVDTDINLVDRIATLAQARQSYPALRRGSQEVLYSPAGGCAPPDTGNDPTEAFGAEMFVRGSFNGWADPPPEGDAFANLGGGLYEARVPLGADTWGYKVAAGDWSVELAYRDGETALDTEVTLVSAAGPGAEGAVTVSEAGCYSWTMDANDVAAPRLTISQLFAGSPTDVLALRRQLDGAVPVVIVLNNEDDPVDLGTLGSGGIPVGAGFADGPVTEITGADAGLSVAGGLLQGTVPARTTYLVID